MNEFQLALLVGAAFVALTTLRLERSFLWICAGAASFVASTAWARYGLPLPPLFTGLCDAVVCLLIYGLARQRWELHLYRIFQASVLVSMVFLILQSWGPAVASRYMYVIILELLNWAALALILGAGITQGIGDHGGFHHNLPRRGLRWAERALLAPKTTDRWWQR